MKTSVSVLLALAAGAIAAPVAVNLLGFRSNWTNLLTDCSLSLVFPALLPLALSLPSSRLLRRSMTATTPAPSSRLGTLSTTSATPGTYSPHISKRYSGRLLLTNSVHSDVVLVRDGTNVQTNDRCTVGSGNWISPYDGTAFTQGHDLDIDHMVPLKNAWVVRTP